MPYGIVMYCSSRRKMMLRPWDAVRGCLPHVPPGTHHCRRQHHLAQPNITCPAGANIMHKRPICVACGYEKDGFAVLADGFEPTNLSVKSFALRQKVKSKAGAFGEIEHFVFGEMKSVLLIRTM